MSKDIDRSAGRALIETGMLARFEVLTTHVSPSPDGDTSAVSIEIQLGDPDEDDGEDEAEWAAFGFLFVLTVLSFHEARPRGYSEKEYVERDELTVVDFFDGLRFVRGGLQLDLN